MNMDAFLHRLHADPDRAGPVDWEVDWEDAPLKYKLYRGLPAISLSAEMPLELASRNRNGPPHLSEIGHFLWFSYGVTQWSETSYTDPDSRTAHSVHTHRRFAPSGGGLYPNEIYMYLNIRDVPAGIYHYDAAHHRLVQIRQGNFDSYLARTLGNRCEMSACFGVLFVSTVFWKNYFKYHDFAYRLQGLDAGALIGQTMEAAERFGFEAALFFRFMDRPANHLLGLSDLEESVYAIIPLSTERDADWLSDRGGERTIAADELCRELETVRPNHFVRSRTVKPYPMLIRMNDASMIERSESLRRIGTAHGGDSGIRANYLPLANRLKYDLAAVGRNRFSPETEFVLGKVTGAQIGDMLQEAVASFKYRNDLDGFREHSFTRVFLHMCLYQVEGVPDGAYRYDPAAHALRRIAPGDHRPRLQYGMYFGNVNLFQVPLCFHVTGNTDFFKPELGYRGYRIQQMEAGILVQRLLLAASAVGMGGRPLLGFHASLCDDLYNLTLHGKRSLIQIPIGPYRHSPRLQGSVHA